MVPKRGFIISVFTALALGLLPSCADKTESNGPSESGSEASASRDTSSGASSQEDEKNEDRYTFSHGSFTLIDGWCRYDPQSTDDKPFFVPKDYDGAGIPDNISVKHGTNHYAKDDPISFGRAITAQLVQQVQGYATDEVTASGITSDMGEPVLVFNIPTKNGVTTQYYICGDHEHILVHETNYSGSAECDEVAKAIVNTFEWNDQN